MFHVFSLTSHAKYEKEPCWVLVTWYYIVSDVRMHIAVS